MFDDIYNTAPPTGATKTEKLNSSAQKRRKKIRRSTYLTVLIISAALILLAFIASLFLFRVQSVEIVNQTGCYKTSEIKNAANDGTYRNMFFPRGNSLKEKLEKEFPYLTIDTSAFEKDFNARTLTATAVYVEPALCIPWNGKYVVMSEDFKVLDGQQTVPTAGIPTVTGAKLTSVEEGAQANFAELSLKKVITENLQMLEDAGIDTVEELDITDTRDIKVYLSDGGTILLGTSSISKTKTAFLKELYSRHKEEGTNNLYVIEIKNSKDAYIRVLEETLPEETETQDTGLADLTQSELSGSEETPVDDYTEETTDGGYTSPIFAAQQEEEQARGNSGYENQTEETATEETTGYESSDEGYVSPIFEAQQAEESARGNSGIQG